MFRAGEKSLVVYLDLIFLMNFAIDGCLLLLTAWLRSRKVVIWRLLLSAGVGASYVVMMFMPALSFLFTFLVKFLFSVGMLWIAFGFISLQNYIRNLGAFYIVNFSAAGGILGIHYLLQSSGELWNGIWYTTTGGMGFSLEIGTLFTLVVFTIVLLWFRMVVAGRRRQETLSTYYADVRIVLGETEIACTGLIDTGNQLRDPLSRLPVMVTEMSLWLPYMPQGFDQGTKNNELAADNLILQWTEDEAFPWRDRLRLIPYRGVNRGSQFMLALKPDKVTVTLENKSYVTSRVLVGLDGGTLSSEGSYRAIIHPALMEEEQQAGNGIREDKRS